MAAEHVEAAGEGAGQKYGAQGLAVRVCHATGHQGTDDSALARPPRLLLQAQRLAVSSFKGWKRLIRACLPRHTGSSLAPSWRRRWRSPPAHLRMPIKPRLQHSTAQAQHVLCASPQQAAHAAQRAQRLIRDLPAAGGSRKGGRTPVGAPDGTPGAGAEHLAPATTAAPGPPHAPLLPVCIVCAASSAAVGQAVNTNKQTGGQAGRHSRQVGRH